LEEKFACPHTALTKNKLITVNAIPKNILDKNVFIKLCRVEALYIGALLSNFNETNLLWFFPIKKVAFCRAMLILGGKIGFIFISFAVRKISVKR